MQIAHISADLKEVMTRREQGLDEDWSEDALSADEEVTGAHRSPRSAHRSPRTTHHSPRTTSPPQVAALAEERVAALEERLGAAYGAELAGAQQRSNNAVESLTVRLQALEAAVQQEQQSSLKALQAILHSAHAR